MLFCALHVVHQNTITARTHNTQTFTIFLDSSLFVPRINHVRRRRGGRAKEEEEEGGGEDGKDKRKEKERETSSRARKQNAVRSTLLFASRVQGRPPPRLSRGRYSLV